MSRSSRINIITKLKNIGPAAIITASFIGPGTLTTATRAGANFQHALLWAVLFSIGMTIILQEMAARLGIVTRRGLGEAIHDQFTQPILKFMSIWLIIIAICVGCAAYMAGDLLGTSMGITTLFDVPTRIVTPIIGVLILFLGLTGNYKIIEYVMLTLVVIMSITFITVMFVVTTNWHNIIMGTLLPRLPDGSILLVIALIGTTVVPYNLFLHASFVQERWQHVSDLKAARFDTVVSIVIGGLITAAILITAGATMYGVKVVGITDLAKQLEPLLGRWSTLFISIGMFSAGFSSALASALGAAVTVSSVLKWRGGMGNPKFKAVFSGIIIIGIVTSFLGFQPLDILILAQALNGLLLPIIAIYLLIVANSRQLLGVHSNGLLLNSIGIIVVAVCILLGGYSIIDALFTINPS